jgi:hypothetical protein
LALQEVSTGREISDLSLRILTVARPRVPERLRGGENIDGRIREERQQMRPPLVSTAKTERPC